MYQYCTRLLLKIKLLADANTVLTANWQSLHMLSSRYPCLNRPSTDHSKSTLQLQAVTICQHPGSVQVFLLETPGVSNALLI